MKAKDSMILLAITGLLLISSLARAESNNAPANPQNCVEREVVMVVRSGNGVHYSEEAEGDVISTTKVLDCGDSMLVTPAPTSETRPGRVVVNPDLRNVEDEIPR